MAASLSSTSVETDDGANLLPQKLWFHSTDTNYLTWKAQMVSLIQGRKMLGFINGKNSPPAETIVDPSDGWTMMVNPAYVMWKRSDELVKEWILGSLNDDLVPNVASLNNSRDVWAELERTFNEHLFQREFQSDTKKHCAAAAMKPPPKYMPVYRAALRGDWEAAKSIFDVNPHLHDHDQLQERELITKLVQPIVPKAAIGAPAKLSIDFVCKAMKYLCDDSIAYVDATSGDTALHIAAAVGNTSVAILLVERMHSLLYICNNDNNFPLHVAADYCHKDVLKYLISCTRDDLPNNNPYAGTHGLRLLFFVIEAEFFDIALELVEKYPRLVAIKDENLNPLKKMATMKSAFSGEKHCRFWKSFLSSIFRIKSSAEEEHDKYLQAQKLVRCLCKNMESLNDEDLQDIYVDAILMAARSGIPEVVDVILETFPDAISCSDPDTGHNIFHEAVKNRCEEVFNRITENSDNKYLYSDVQDTNGNNLLHLVAKLAPTHKLNQVSGAALQMQRELQWYKEVEKFVSAGSRSRSNNAGKTPDIVFTEQHKELKKAGEKWMKDTANSCTIASALITTIMFAAAITVPGGNESGSGFPIFSKDGAFIVFAIADAVSLFTSTTSLLMFLALLTSRYAEERFLQLMALASLGRKQETIHSNLSQFA